MAHAALKRSAAAVVLVACSPSPRVEPPPPASSVSPALASASAPATSASVPMPSRPPAATYVVTRSSDEWVARSFVVQTSYAHVLAVFSDGKAPRTIKSAPLDLNARTPGAPIDLAVTSSFTSIQDAVKAARGGDLIAVLPGEYAGFSVSEIPGTSDGHYLHIKAIGAPGSVRVTSACTADSHWMVLIQRAHHVILEGFAIEGGPRPGQGAWAGIFLDGDFAHSSELLHHVAVIRNFSHDHEKWGLHSTDTRTVLIQDNLFARSIEEHGAYVSDGSDDYVIRRNVFFQNDDAGLQCNVDPLASFGETGRNPRLADYPKKGKTREWALGLMERANALFGEGNYPDGKGFNFIIEENVMNQNGKGGGGAINLAGIKRSLIQNNLVYDNHAHGIVGWDNINPYDEAAVKAQNPADPPLFGCSENLIRNNTVLMSADKRTALLAIHGSFGETIENNVLVNDQADSIEVDPTSLVGFVAQHDLVNHVTFDAPSDRRGELTKIIGDGGLTQKAIWQELVAPSDAPWVVIEKGWWKLNPKRPDFHPKKTSKLLSSVADASSMPARDLEGAPRSSGDIGALVAK